MSLTRDENRLFAALWLKAADACVLDVKDASLVSERTLDAIAMGLTPCARERTNAHEARPVRRPDHPNERHSSWVH